MLAGSGSSITGAASMVVRDSLDKNVVVVSNSKRKIAASNVSLSSLQSEIIGGATTIIDCNLTPNKVVVSDADGKATTSSISHIEVGYLASTNDLTQTQFNSEAHNQVHVLKQKLVIV